MEQKGGGSWTKTVGILAAGAAVSLFSLTMEDADTGEISYFLYDCLIAVFPYVATLIMTLFFSFFTSSAKTAGAIAGVILLPLAFVLGPEVAHSCRSPISSLAMTALGGITFVVSLTIFALGNAFCRSKASDDSPPAIPSHPGEMTLTATEVIPQRVPLWRSQTAAILLICILLSTGFFLNRCIFGMVENFEGALFFTVFPYLMIFGLTLVASLLTDAARPAGSASGIFFFVMTFGLNAFLLSFLLQKFGTENTILPFLFRLLFNPLLTSITIYLICLLFAVMIGRHHRKHLAPPAQNEPLG